MKLSSILVATAALAGTSSAYRLSVYSSDNYQGTQRTYTTSGSRSVGFTVKSWIWESTLGDGCCVNFCKGSTVCFFFLFPSCFPFLFFDFSSDRDTYLTEPRPLLWKCPQGRLQRWCQ